MAIGAVSFISAVVGSAFARSTLAEAIIGISLVVGAVFFVGGIPVLIATVGFSSAFFSAFMVALVALALTLVAQLFDIVFGY